MNNYLQKTTLFTLSVLLLTVTIAACSSSTTSIPQTDNSIPTETQPKASPAPASKPASPAVAVEPDRSVDLDDVAPQSKSKATTPAADPIIERISRDQNLPLEPSRPNPVEPQMPEPTMPEPIMPEPQISQPQISEPWEPLPTEPTPEPPYAPQTELSDVSEPEVMILPDIIPESALEDYSDQPPSEIDSQSQLAEPSQESQGSEPQAPEPGISRQY